MLTGLLIKNIKSLVQVEDVPKIKVCGREMSEIQSIDNAYIYIADGLISDFGKMDELMQNQSLVNNSELKTIDASGRFVFPSFCDSHTHLVYSGSREIEYTDKIRGLTYEEIAKRGGGILNSSKKLHETSEDELFRQSLERINEIISLGTGAVEIKSGYGLNLHDELKMLRVIKKIKQTCQAEIRSTFLGAHAIPEE
jgi:imidazolonepropionase